MITAVTAGGLFTLLVFTTVTVFVQTAWALQVFQIGIFALVAFHVLMRLGRPQEQLSPGWTHFLIYLVPLWGIVQIVAHSTASTAETRAAVLKWGALAGVFFLSQTVGNSRRARRLCQDAFLIFATVEAVLCLTQLFTSEGKVLWLIPTGYEYIVGTFQNWNNFAQFIELALPIALWRAVREGFRSWWYPLSGGILYGSVIIAASRTGVALCTAELFAIMIFGLLIPGDRASGSSSRTTKAILLVIPLVAIIFTAVAGWERILTRFKENDPYLVRKEFLIAAIRMTEHRPWIGNGLGTFPEVYQQFAVRDFPFYANHAHNDWAEFAADGGIPFLILLFVPFAAAVPAAFRNPWGIGLVAVMIHACVDFPFPRPAVSGWMFALLGLLCMTRIPERQIGT